MPFNPTDELEMHFSVAEWNEIIAQLQEGPYKKTAPIINKINLQAAQLEAAQREQQAAIQAAQERQEHYTNGEIAPQPDLVVPTGDIVIGKADG